MTAVDRDRAEVSDPILPGGIKSEYLNKILWLSTELCIETI